MAVGRVAVLYYRQIRIARAHVYRQVSKLAIADKLSQLMQTCSPVVKYNYNSNSNLLSMTSSKVRASKLELLVY